LSAAKALRGKGQVDIELRPDGAALRSGAAVVDLQNISYDIPRFLRVPREVLGSASHDGMGLLAKLMPAAVGDGKVHHEVYLDIDDRLLSLTATDGVTYAAWHPRVRKVPAVGGFLGKVEVDFLEAVRDLTEPGVIAWTDAEAPRRTEESQYLVPGTPGLLYVSSGRYVALSTLTRNPDWFPGEPPSPVGLVSVEVDRKSLIDTLMGLAPSDEHARVFMTADTAGGTGLHLRDWSHRGTVTLPADCVNNGDSGLDANVGINAARMVKLLKALPGKTVRMEWDWGRNPIRLISEEAQGWNVMLARIAR
jgi:hypothetical protein